VRIKLKLKIKYDNTKKKISENSEALEYLGGINPGQRKVTPSFVRGIVRGKKE
jgi:hypothetical protein